MVASSRHTGWYKDAANARLDFYYEGTRVGHINGTSFVTALAQTVTGALTQTGVATFAVGSAWTTGDLGMVAGTLDLQDGGVVTQATNKTTGVTLSTHSGQITLNNAALAAAAEVEFLVTNTLVGVNDVIIVNVGSGATNAETYVVGVGEINAGSFRIYVGNVSAGSLSEALVLNFAVIKGAAS